MMPVVSPAPNRLVASIWWPDHYFIPLRMADTRNVFVAMLHVKLHTSRQNPYPLYVSLRGTGPAGKAANGELEHDLLSA